MDVDEQLGRLSRQLSKQSLGPIDTILDQMTSRLGSWVAFAHGMAPAGSV
jgi:hypothetical protein